MRHYFAALLILAVTLVPWFAATHPAATQAVVAAIERAGSELAAVLVAHDPVTVDQLKADYASAGLSADATSTPAKKVRILIVPGHEPDYGGAEYRDLKERDMTVELAQDLIGFLGKNDRFDVFTTRTSSSWTPEFAGYFKSEWKQIIDWMHAHRAEQLDLSKVGEYTRTKPLVYHSTARDDVALRLYGINKWVDENGIDVVIHIHFNDYPGHGAASPGKYTGFAIYVPQSQYYNSTSTRAVADTIYKRLSKYNAVSNLPGESNGIVEEQDLIAIGSYNSVDAASMLVEYGYIYEPQFQSADVRHETLKELAYETYIGLMDFFDPKAAAQIAGTFDTLALPHRWQGDVAGKDAPAKDVFALQTALILDGDYPPSGSSANDCPRSGKVGPCTMSAIDQFQAKYGITGEKDTIGEKTIETLNRIYSSQSAQAQ